MRSVWLRRVLQWGLTIAVTWLIMDRVGVTLDEAWSLEEVWRHSALATIGLSVFVLLLGFGFSARLWGWMTGELGDRDPGVIASMRIVFTANLGRYVPGKVWQVTGLALLSRREGVSGTIGATAGVLGQAFSLAAAGVIAAPILMGRDEDLGRGVPLVLGVLVMVVLAASVPRLLRLGVALIFRLARVSPVEPPHTGVSFGPRWLAAYLLNWLIYALAFVLFLKGLGFDTAPITFAASFAAAYLLGYVAVFAPAGIGIREGFLVAFLQPEVGTAAVGIAILARVWMTLVELLPAGGLALWEIFRRDRNGGPPLAKGDRILGEGERA